MGLLAPPPALGSIARMSLWKSPTVNEWIVQQEAGKPQHFKAWKPMQGQLEEHRYHHFGYGNFVRRGWVKPKLSRRDQSLLVKRAIKAGEIKLEPTVMPDTTNIFKGSKDQRNRPARLAEIEAKMADMPKKIAEYKAARLEKRRAVKRDAYFK